MGATGFPAFFPLTAHPQRQRTQGIEEDYLAIIFQASLTKGGAYYLRKAKVFTVLAANVGYDIGGKTIVLEAFCLLLDGMA